MQPCTLPFHLELDAKQLNSHAGHSMGQLTPRNLANICHGLAKMQHHPGQPLLQACAGQAVACLAHRPEDFAPQNHANLLWAFATLGEGRHFMLLLRCHAARVKFACTNDKLKQRLICMSPS